MDMNSELDAQYTYLMTDHDLYRLHGLVSVLADAIAELFEKRQLMPIDALDTDPDRYEMRLRELAAAIAGKTSSTPDRR